MTKEQYKQAMKRHGYEFKGDKAYLQTPYGLWVQKIIKYENGWAMETVKKENKV